MVASQEDIELADEVRKYPALYNKACSDYHDAGVVKNCWSRVQKILGLESVDVAKDRFNKLRKRFNKQRQKMLKAKVSGTSRAEMLESCGGEDTVNGYEYLLWLREAGPPVPSSRSRHLLLFAF